MTKKIGAKVVAERLDFLLQQVLTLQKTAEYLNQLIVNYVLFNKDVDKFKDFLIKRGEENGNSSNKSTKGNENTSGSNKKPSKRKLPIKGKIKGKTTKRASV
jgi:hypothetical protein